MPALRIDDNCNLLKYVYGRYYSEIHSLNHGSKIWKDIARFILVVLIFIIFTTAVFGCDLWLDWQYFETSGGKQWKGYLRDIYDFLIIAVAVLLIFHWLIVATLPNNERYKHCKKWKFNILSVISVLFLECSYIICRETLVTDTFAKEMLFNFLPLYLLFAATVAFGCLHGCLKNGQSNDRNSTLNDILLQDVTLNQTANINNPRMQTQVQIRHLLCFVFGCKHTFTRKPKN